MAADNPCSPNAATVQGPGPTGNEGYPIAVVGAPGGDPVQVTVVSGGGGAVTIADGADVNQGATTDAANTTGATGTMSGKLRGLLQILVSVWVSATGVLRHAPLTVTGAAATTIGSSSWPTEETGSVRLTHQVLNFISNAFTSGSDTLARGEGHAVSTLFASAARTTAQTSSLFQQIERRGCRVFLNVTAVPAVPGAGGLTVIIEVRDPVSLAFQPLLTAAVAVQATGLYTYTVYPAATAGDTQNVESHIGTNCRVRIAVGDAQSYTYSVGLDRIK